MGKSAFKKRMRVLFQSLEGQVVLDYRMPDGSLFKGLEPWFVPYSSAQWAASDPWDIEVAAPRVAPRHTHTGTRSSSESQPHPPTPTTPSPAAATAPGPGHAETAQPSIVPQHGPDSPYALRAPTASVLEALYQRFVIHLNMSHWESRVVAVPPCPQTPEAAAELQSHIDQLLADGRTFDACPWQCQVAMYAIIALGKEHPSTLEAVYQVVKGVYDGFEDSAVMCTWLLPLAARHWGLGDPRVRQLVWWGAHTLSASTDLRNDEALHRAVVSVARHLPDGLGWGTATVSDSTDQGEDFNRYVVLHAKALATYKEGVGADHRQPHFKLAKAMAERCVSYFESLGTHWHACVRKAASRKLVADCVLQLEGYTACESVLVQAKIAAKRELGAHHTVTVRLVMDYVCNAMEAGRREAALSLCYKLLQMSRTLSGEYHAKAFLQCVSMVGMAEMMYQADKLQESCNLSHEVFNTTLLRRGPKDKRTRDALYAACALLTLRLGKPKEATALKERAASLGCDVSGCTRAALHAELERRDVNRSEDRCSDRFDEYLLHLIGRRQSMPLRAAYEKFGRRR